MPLASLNLSQMEPHLLQVGDLLITRSGTIGITSVFPGYRMPVIPGAFSIRFRLKESLNPQYARVYFNAHQGRSLLLKEAQGGVQKNITGTAILKLNIPIPSLFEQKMICNRLAKLNKLILLEQEYVRQLTSVKSGLMQDLLTGKVRVQVDEQDAP